MADPRLEEVKIAKIILSRACYTMYYSRFVKLCESLNISDFMTSRSVTLTKH